MRILYIVPGNLSGAIGPDELVRRLEILSRIAAPGTVVEIEENPGGPNSIESAYEEYLSIPGTLEIVESAARIGVDGVIVGCFGDPGVDAARELVAIPVVGPAEAAMLIACTLGHRFSILTVLHSIVAPLTYLARRVGVAGKLASVRTIDIPVLDLASDKHETIERLITLGKRAVDDDGADTLVLGCMSIGFLEAQSQISEAVGVPVVNPIYAAIKLLEALVGAELSPSKRAYPTPPKVLAPSLYLRA